jgi:alkylation response protein AidB-like acyl-CoA dehydrogenase
VLFDRPLAANQAIQIRLAAMARGITGAQLMSLHLGRLKDAGKMTPAQVSLAKWNNCRMAIDVARDARDILGGAGISAEYVPIRHALNLESVITYEGTETIHQLTIGREPRSARFDRRAIARALLAPWRVVPICRLSLRTRTCLAVLELLYMSPAAD